jgi:periplasmic copper chaperone A
MLKSLLGVVLTLCTTLTFAAPETAADVITINNPYVRAVPPGQSNSAAYMVLTNKSAAPHRLVAVTSPMVDHIQIHMTSNNNGVMQMREVGAVDIAAHQSQSFEPGSLHIMLLGLKQPLQPGIEVPLTLIFEDNSSESVRAMVKKLNT